MTEPQEIPWKRIVVEGAAIVASILLAFAIDAWWEDRQLAQETAEDLAIVKAELAENIRLVQVTIDIINQVVEANNDLIGTLSASRAGEFVFIEDTTVFWSLFSNPTFDPSLGGTDAWIATGRLSGLGSPALRQRLASVRGKVDDVVEEHHIAREVGVREIYPLIKGDIGNLEPIQNIIRAGLSARPSTPVLPLSSSETIPIRNSDELRFLLQVRVLWYEGSLHETRDFQKELEEIQVMLEREIQKLES